MHRYRTVIFGGALSLALADSPFLCSLGRISAGGVGKSALTARFVNDTFLSNYDPTIEEVYECSSQVDDTTYSLEILDTAGVDQFHTLNERYIKSAHGFILVFSLTQETSLREIEDLRRRIYHLRGDDRQIPIVVVGTKLDLAAEREVSQELIRSYAVRWGVPFYETSAKRNWNVRPSFEDLIRQMRARFPYPAKTKTRRGKSKTNKTFTDVPRPDRCLIM
ncbi:ras-domain-containing protein [Thelephora ganbajun]|uniref:Ras-domain-containing protein n=1 Tax=Thelephora ganbajun TaxID=370292 RepID=A0ACB6ZK40_THEGA|nr:ras-domain-containing protein [Thelephora ganbajun]